MFDVIVVGGRCAGSATAFLLARKGLKVLVLEKAQFPRDIPHGHFIHRHGPRLLHRWGLADNIVRSNCPPVTKMTLDLGDFPLTGIDLMRDGVPLGYGPRRIVLDAVLLEAAAAAGAEVREGFSVEDYVFEGTTVKGIRGRSHGNGGHAMEHAHITIGADGRHSSLARAVRAATYEEVPPLTCWYFSYWSDSAVDGLEVYLRNRNVIFAFPTNDGLTAVFIAWDIAEFPRVREDVEGNFMGVLQRVPDLEQRMRAGKREERFYGTADLPNFFRKPFGPGWALVGDAGHHKDPCLALGICDALRDAELLASAVEEGLSGSKPLEDLLAGYERDRNSAGLSDYRENIAMAQFQPIPRDVLAIRAAVRGDQEDTNRFFLARQGMIPPAEFFNPQNIEQLKRRISTVA